jgi:O-antigen ligase
VGCTLAAVHALVPAFDPFAISRPDDIPFVSAIGSFARATGAFTYPNNLGSYAAYAVLLGAAAWLFGRPTIPKRLAVAVMVSGAAALLLAGSRAAGLGLVVGILYLTYKAAPGRRVVLIAAEVAAGLLVVTLVLSSPTAREVTDQRIETATGQSITGRIEDWRGALGDFRESPLIGTGASESRTDNFWLLYLAQAGAVGVALLCLLAHTTFRRDRAAPEEWAPELKIALLLALCVSGLLQDSLGQTLTTWFLGALIGLSMLRPDPPAPAAANEPVLSHAGAAA